MNVDIEVAILAGVFALIGVVVTSAINLIATWVTDKREKNKTIFLWAEEKKLRDEERNIRDSERMMDYYTKRISMIRNLSKPLQHHQIMKDLLISEHIRLVGESVFSKQTLLVLRRPDLANVVDQVEEVFYKVWEKRMMNSDHIQNFDDELLKIEELSRILHEGLSQISKRIQFLVDGNTRR